MQLVYSNENRIFVMNAKNQLENAGISVQLKNEYCSSGVTAGNLVWPELWVKEEDHATADQVLQQKQDEKIEEWLCETCGENNPASLNQCWCCQTIAKNAE